MNRKFKVWDKVSKTMSHEFYLFGEFTMVGGVFAWLADVREVNSCTIESLNDLIVLQYTGLNYEDTGEPVYEGDIVQDRTFDGIPSGVVVFEYGQFAVKYKSKWHTSGFDSDGVFFWKPMKIGNIYENTELMDYKV